MKKKFVLECFAAVSIVLCSLSPFTVAAQDKKLVKLGIRASGIEVVDTFKDEVSDAGFEIETVVFDDAVQPNTAVDEGSIDMNFYQHEAYMLAFNENNDTQLVMIKPTVYYGRYCLFSDKYESLDEIPDNPTFAISNDPSNQDRGLRLLEDLEMITLKEGIEVVTLLDIEDNPKNIQFTTANNSVLPQSLPDVDGVLVSSTHIYNAGLDASKFLAETDDGGIYRIGFVVDESISSEDWINEFVDAALCEDLYNYLIDKDVDVPMFEFDKEGNRTIMDAAK